jgi:thioredoxin 1
MKLLKFYASWCGPCKGLSMVINGAKDKISIPIEEIDIDQNMDAVKKYNIRGVPVLILAEDDGTEIDRMTGAADEKKLLEFIGD